MITGYRRYEIYDYWRPIAQPQKSMVDPILVGAQTEWPERQMTAQCGSSQEVCELHLLHGAGAYECTCGIYVLKQPDMIQGYSNWPALVAVTGWGAYLEMERGWRIQHVRMEHIWIEPTWLNQCGYDTDFMVQSLEQRYGVGVEVRTNAVCCGREHEMGYWESSNGPIAICQMSTEYIVAVLRHLNPASRKDRYAAKWRLVFEQELKSREPKQVDGKTIVRF